MCDELASLLSNLRQKNKYVGENIESQISCLMLSAPPRHRWAASEVTADTKMRMGRGGRCGRLRLDECCGTMVPP